MLPEEPAKLADPEHELALHAWYTCLWGNVKTSQPSNRSRVVAHIVSVKTLRNHCSAFIPCSLDFHSHTCIFSHLRHSACKHQHA